MKEKISGGLFGLAVADALGVPVEFTPRRILKENPVTGMRGFGTYDQPPGTWSDDTSLTLCLMDSLAQTEAPDYGDIMKNFASWLTEGKYTPHGEAFGVGHSTRKAILLSLSGKPPLECGGTALEANGNGSLMRILPMAYYLYPMDDPEACLREVHRISSLTHAHPLSKIACGIYVLLLTALLKGKSCESAVSAAGRYYSSHKEFSPWLEHFHRILDVSGLEKLSSPEISSSTYVIHSLEAAFWCFLTTDSYRGCVLKAANLGEDTDTVAAIAGGLAGTFYGKEDIPAEWIHALVRKDCLDEIMDRFTIRVSSEKHISALNHL